MSNCSRVFLSGMSYITLYVLAQLRRWASFLTEYQICLENSIISCRKPPKSRAHMSKTHFFPLFWQTAAVAHHSFSPIFQQFRASSRPRWYCQKGLAGHRLEAQRRQYLSDMSPLSLRPFIQARACHQPKSSYALFHRQSCPVVYCFHNAYMKIEPMWRTISALKLPLAVL